MAGSLSVMQSWKEEGRAEGLIEGMARGMAEARRADILRALQLRFPGTLPAEVSATVRSFGELELLNRWFDAAVTAPTVESFRLLTGL
jgi:hypothetical protein